MRIEVPSIFALSQGVQLLLCSPMDGKTLWKHLNVLGLIVYLSMLLSIIVAVKNDAEMLERLLVDLESQSFGYYEVIIVDGGSSDGSDSVAQKHGVKYISSSDTQWGRDMRSHAFDKNLGSEKAEGEWLFHLDSDMKFSDPGQLQRIMDFVVENDVVAGSTMISGHNGGMREITRRLIDPVLTQTIIVRKDVFMELGMFPITHLLDVGLHNRYVVHGYKPILIPEELEHLRDYKEWLPRDLDWLPGVV